VVDVQEGEVTPEDYRLMRQPGSYVMKKLIARFVKDESGATAIEYGLIAAGISIAIIVAVNGLGSNLNSKFTDINSSLK
jgi:pilus assembly protein Flp/PilA